MNIDSLERTNWYLAATLNDLRNDVDWMDFGQQGCEPGSGIIGIIGTLRNIPIVKDALEEAFFKTTGSSRIDEDTYFMVKQEIDDIEDYVNSYLRLVGDNCSCKRQQTRQ